jgi:hypothetical protein
VNRFKDYACFAIWFAGLGYIVLWPLTSPDHGGQPFGASFLCRAGASMPLAWLCNSAHPLTLPPALHVIGLLSAVAVTVRALLAAIRRSRLRKGAPGLGAPALGAPALPGLRLARRKARRPAAYVAPRAQFGLRGTRR